MIKTIPLNTITLMSSFNSQVFIQKNIDLSIDSSRDRGVSSYVYTPDGDPVPATDHTIDTDYTASEIADRNAQIAALNLSDVTLLSNPSLKYNCHSYAWYMQDSSHNHYSIDNPSVYTTGYSYNRIYVGIQAGDIICYYNYLGVPIHSGRITSVLGGTSNGICGDSNLYQVTSKWGLGFGLYSHRGDQCIYTSCCNFFSSPSDIASEVRFYRIVSSHNHSWSYIQHSKYAHLKHCLCSTAIYEGHNWVSNSKDNSCEEEESEKGTPSYICSQCYQTAIFPF